MNKLINLEPFSLNLDQYKVLEVSGSDALTFLNSQTTNNVKSLNSKSFHFDALLDVSGKIETYFITIKKEDSSFYLLIPTFIYDESLLRIQKFHITEDVNFNSVDLKLYMNFFTEKKDFMAKLGTYDIEISTEPKSELIIDDEQILTFLGLPIFNKTIKLGEIFNNTLLSNIAIDFNKGCFIGQETVSKIHTRRGAAKAPVFLKTNADLELNTKVKSFSTAIGEVLHEISVNESKFYLCLLNRENRVNNKEIFIDLCDDQTKATIKTLPLFTLEQLSLNLYYEAVMDFQNSKESEAILKLKNIINADPSLFDAYESLGVIYGRQEKFQEAVDVMHELEFINSKSVMAQTNLSMFYMKLGEIEKAEIHKSNATVNQFSSFGNIADEKRAKEEKEKQKESELKRREEMFEQVLKIDPKDPLATYGLGELRLTQEKFTEAKKLLKTTIESDEKYSVAYLALAKSYIELNELDEALIILKKGIEISSTNGDLMPANEMQSILVNLNTPS